MIIFTTTCIDLPQKVNHLIVTWAMLCFLAYSTYLYFTIISWWGIADQEIYSLIKVYPDGFLKVTGETRNRNWLFMWGLINDIINSPQNSKLFVFISLVFIAYINWQLTLLISGKKANATSLFFFFPFFFFFFCCCLQVMEPIRWSGFFDTSFSEIVYLIQSYVFFLSLVT